MFQLTILDSNILKSKLFRAKRWVIFEKPIYICQIQNQLYVSIFNLVIFTEIIDDKIK